jgi:PKD repeat protein
MKKAYIFPLLLLFSFNPIFAQNHSCGTDEVYSEREAEDPSLLGKRIQFENFLTEIAEHPGEAKLGKKASYTVPVVFHVFHQYGEENISKAQILDGLRVLNEDYSRTNADKSKTRSQFLARAGNPDIEFKLAQKDPWGNCTDGINRIASGLTVHGDVNSAIKRQINWPYKDYLNIWVIQELGREAGGTGYVIGFATFPWAAGSVDNGIVIRQDYVGTIGTANRGYAGRSLTHEVGHWLGLLHPFQGSCGNSNCSRAGDRLCDTPPVKAASYGCPTSNNTCSNDSPDEMDQIENFMDYANGSCANMFTNGQVTVMKSTLNSYRSNIHSTGNLNDAGIGNTTSCAPVADFHTESRVTTVCAGGNLTFEDMSWKGEVTDRVWTFEGGQPSSSTFENPTVTYNTPGVYKVTLQSKNAAGQNSKVKTNFITVKSKISDIATPFYDELENSTDFLADYVIGPENGTFGWRRTTGYKYSGSFGLEARINALTPDNSKYSIILPPIDMRSQEGLEPKISFRVAYSLREQNNGELLIIFGSDDCGVSWKSLGGMLGSSVLASKEGLNPGWTPSSKADWKIVSKDVDRYGFDTVSNLMIRIEVQSRGGNSVFIDDINVNQFVLSVNTPEELEREINLFPNPSRGEFNIDLGRLATNKTAISIYDVTGKEITVLREMNPDGTVKIGALNSGIYYVKIKNNQSEITKRVIIAE